MIAVPRFDLLAAGVLVSTNATNAAAYNAATTYALDATCAYAGRTWRSLQAGNVGHTPDTEPLWWLDAGPLNTEAMFDTSAQTTTETTGGLTVTLNVGRATVVSLMGMVGQAVTLTVRDGLAGPVIYTDTKTLRVSDGTYYSWCFEDFLQQPDATWTGLLGSIDGHITIEITGAGTTACGLCVVGKQIDIGQAEYGFSTPIEDRGRDYLDALGNPVSIERGHSKTASGTLVSTLVGYNRLMAFYAAHRGEICLFIAAPDMADLVAANIVGKIARVVPVIANPVQITTSLEISGTR
jgi:hypothetical protein